MTQANLLERAKQGDPQAIAALMNRTLQPKGITAQADLRGDRLQVMLEAEQIPNRQAMTTFVQNGITSLGINAIRSIEILGRQIGVADPAWTQEIYLGMPAHPTPLPPPSDQAPPRPRPNPPPVPPRRPSPPTSPPVTPPVTAPVPAPVATDPLSVPTAATAGEPLAYPIEAETDGFSPFTNSAAETAVQQPAQSMDELLERIDRHAPMPPVAPPARPAGRSPWLFLVLLVMLGWVGAIVGYALWKNFTNPQPQPIPVAPPAPAVTSPAPSPTISPTTSPSPASPATSSSANPYQEALNKGNQAAQLTQTAQSADDWGLVISQWQQAIALLKSVPAGSPDYATAQTQLSADQANLATAQQQAASQPAPTNAPPPFSTVTISGDIACSEVASTADSQPIELSSVQIKPGEGEGAKAYLVGCVTNHTNQAIASVGVSYQGGSAQNPSLIQSGFSPLSFSNLAARQTVPFRGTFEISPEVTNLTIQAVYWTPPGASQPQEIPSPLTLTQ